ncbi:hypothetical protein GGI22_004400 [Coemansia erecta]|nr:hypothetical protein GGI22_004400 [Coemansia erecta]
MASGVNAFTLGVGRGTPIHDKVGDYDGSASELDDQPTKMLEDIVDVARRLKSKGIGVFNARVASQELFRSGKMPGCEDNVYSVWTNDHYCPAWQIIHDSANVLGVVLETVVEAGPPVVTAVAALFDRRARVIAAARDMAFLDECAN